MAHTYRLSCISLCSSILQLLNRVKPFSGHSVSVEGWVAKVTLLGHFAGISLSRSLEGLSEQKARNRVYAFRRLTIPKDCIFPITVFDVAMVLTQRGRGRRRWNVNYIYGCPPCFWRVCGTVESGIRNSQPFSFFYLRKIISPLQYFFASLFNINI